MKEEKNKCETWKTLGGANVKGKVDPNVKYVLGSQPTKAAYWFMHVCVPLQELALQPM